MARFSTRSLMGLTLLAALAAFVTVGKLAAARQDLQQKNDAQETGSTKQDGPEKIDTPLLPNAYRLYEKVISGGLPEGDAAFAELARLGVKTIISVDGATPDIETAKQHGLRYVHLPHGYNGIPEQRIMELARAVRDLPGPIYIHCHHGKHRSPAAATAACIAAGFISPNQALNILTTAGTSPNYQGLYQAAEHARKLDQKLLDELQVEFHETEKIPPMAEAMVGIEHTHDHLKYLAAEHKDAAGQPGRKWQPTAEHPDLDPAHEALMLREHFTELLRTPEARQRPQAFVASLKESEAAATELEAVLRDMQLTDDARGAAADKALARISNNCSSCHKQFRDIPLGEKK